MIVGAHTVSSLREFQVCTIRTEKNRFRTSLVDLGRNNFLLWPLRVEFHNRSTEQSAVTWVLRRGLVVTGGMQLNEVFWPFKSLIEPI